jgi:hypothetical protein
MNDKKEVYTDLEQQRLNEKHETLRMEVIEYLVKQYINDSELGKAIRYFVNLKDKVTHETEDSSF